MNEDNALRMAAEVTDRFTVPLKKLQEQLRKIKTPPNISEVQKDFNRLGQTVNSASEAIKSTFIPVLGALGITTFTVGAALAKVVTSMIDLSKETVELSFLAKETGISINNIRDMQAASASLGVDNASFQKNLRNFSIVMEQINRRQGNALKWMQASPNQEVRRLAEQLVGTTDNFKAFNMVMEFLQTIKEPAQWNYWVNNFQLDIKQGRAATKDWDSELAKARAKHGTLTDADIKAAEDYKTAMGNLKGQFDQFVATVAREALPAITKLIEATITWMTSNGDQLAKDIREVAEGLNELTESMTKFKAALGAIIAVGLGSWIGGLAGAAIGLYAAYRFMKGFEMPEWMTKLGELVSGDSESAEGEKKKEEGGGKPPEEPKPEKSSFLEEEEAEENLEEGSKEAFLQGLRDYYGPDGGGATDISASRRFGGGTGAGTGGGRGSWTGGDTPTRSDIGGGIVSGNANLMRGVDPKLVELAQAGAEYLPEGYTLRPTSGVRARTNNYSLHPRGIASDWQIYGPDGKPIANVGDDVTGLYTLWARGAYTEALNRYGPETAARLGWGGAFATHPGGNLPDLMHLDWGGQRGRLRPGNILENLGPLSKEEQEKKKRKSLLNSGKQSGLIGAPPIGSDASLRVKIDLNGFPRGTQFASNMGGIVNSVSINRNRPPMNERGAA